MPETTPAESSPAETKDVFNGETPTLAEFQQYRETGEVPERFKPAAPAESAPADEPEETEPAGDEPETVPESEPEETQEPKSKTAKRIKQLLAERHELQQKLDAATKQDVKLVSSPAAAAPGTRSKPTVEDKKDDGTPRYQQYEDFVEDLADWKAEQRVIGLQRQQAEQEARKSLQVKLDEARSRYEDADEVIFPAAQKIQEAQMPLAVKEVFAQSEFFPDLCYVVGSDPDELGKFISLAQSNPRAALAKVFEYERGIREELGKTKEAPVTRKTTAPKPPSPVGGGSSRAFDVSDVSLSAEEWMRKRNAQISSR